MKRTRKNFQFFELPKLDENRKPSRVRFAFERAGDDLQMSITYTVGRENPDLVILLNRSEVENILSHVAAYLLNRDGEEIRLITNQIVKSLDGTSLG